MATSTQNTGSSSNRGFAAMDEERQREIASMGGKAAHASGRAHEFTSQEAREAGRKGGEASHGGHSGHAAKSGGGRSAEDAEGGSNRPGGQSGGGSSHRGFAAMNEERQREIASMGGKAAHASGHAHEFTSQEAREAGRKGGEASHGGHAMRASGNHPGTGRGSGTAFVGTSGGAGKSDEGNRR